MPIAAVQAQDAAVSPGLHPMAENRLLLVQEDLLVIATRLQEPGGVHHQHGAVNHLHIHGPSRLEP